MASHDGGPPLTLSSNDLAKQFADHGEIACGLQDGALLDPHTILMGRAKSIRHITIHDRRELRGPLIRRYLQAAIER
jgi:hypothetical protein